jgi:hypothetical protein
MNEIYDENETEHEDDVITRDFLALAKHYIRQFFKNKVDEHGFEIDVEDLLTERNISLVLNLGICKGMPIIYNAMKSKREIQKRKGKIPEDVQLVLKLLNECSRMLMPKLFAAGLIAIYVEVCKGCKLDL